MSENNRCLFSIGTNLDKHTNMLFAEGSLRKLFDTVSFSSRIESEAVNCPPGTEPYLNCVGVGYTHMDHPKIRTTFKDLETKAGRTPESKIICSIPLDIDILQWNNEVLKPQDLKQPYIIKGIKELEL